MQNLVLKDFFYYEIPKPIPIIGNVNLYKYIINI